MIHVLRISKSERPGRQAQPIVDSRLHIIVESRLWEGLTGTAPGIQGALGDSGISPPMEQALCQFIWILKQMILQGFWDICWHHACRRNIFLGHHLIVNGNSTMPIQAVLFQIHAFE
jgi:hypothetical protein